jgi:hypothetical protein
VVVEAESRGDRIVSPEGVAFARVTSKLSGARATEAVRAGAQLAWDSCGCEGFCDLQWIEPGRVSQVSSKQRMRESWRRGRPGAFSLWLSDDEAQDLVVATGDVVWGDVFT